MLSGLTMSHAIDALRPARESSNTHRSRQRRRGMLVGLLLLTSSGTMLTACGGSGLSASSTCSAFMAASPGAQQQVTDQLAAQYDKPDYATPLGAPEVPYYCASNPNTTLGQFFQKASD
jgi:hypothetical protein